MYYVYIIKSIIYPNKIYTGYTKDLRQRILDHNNGKNVSTGKYKPWELKFYCGFRNKYKALMFEKYLKTSSGIAFKNKRLI